MKKVRGDLLTLAKQGEFDVVVHGCNCFVRMGRGIALSIREQFPEAVEADQRTVPGDRNKLGTCTSATILIGDRELTIVNAYTQYHWEGNGVERLANYEAIHSCMEWIRENHWGKRIGLPMLGAGLARGHWPIIEAVIAHVLKDEDVTIVEYVPS